MPATKRKKLTLEAFGKIDKLWKLLKVALVDFKRCERSKKYVIKMGEWHKPMFDVCAVCLAGSCITNWTSPDKYAAPRSFNTDVDDRLCALSDLGLGGNVQSAITTLRGGIPSKTERDAADRVRNSFDTIPHYDGKKEEWWNGMRHLYSELKKANL